MGIISPVSQMVIMVICLKKTDFLKILPRITYQATRLVGVFE